jgi:predicted ABC-type ATPase
MVKQLTVIAGPNGSGKTTLAREYLSQHEAVYLGADAIAEELSPGTPELAQMPAGRLFLCGLEDALHHDRSLVVESTLSGRSFARVIRLAKKRGFTVTIVFLFLDSADTCVARVQQRKRQGGHGVPESDIRRRFDRSLRNFWMVYRLLADDWAIVYNAASDFQDVAFGAGGNMSVRDEAMFRQFIELAGLSES